MSIEPGKPVKARPAALRRGMPVHDAFRAVMRAGLAHLQASEHGVLKARDPEYLHQMRVALRRLRIAIKKYRYAADFSPASTRRNRRAGR